MHKDNWDDLRFVLAVADHGSVSGAARALNVNHATVLRRVAAFEDRHGSEIFEKTARGYSLPGARTEVIEAAREVESAVLAVGRMIEGTQAPLQGVVKVTSTDTFCHTVLPGVIAEFQKEAADLQIELLCSNQHLDLARLDADITMRPAVTLPDELDGDVVGRLEFAVYANDTGPMQWLGLSGPLRRSRPAIWQADNISSDQISGASDSFIILREMAIAGMGRAVLPCLLGEAEPKLHRIDTVMPKMEVDIWIASHVDLANVPRIQAVRQYLCDTLPKLWATPN